MNDWQQGLDEGLESMRHSVDVAMTGLRAALDGPLGSLGHDTERGRASMNYKFQTGPHTRLSVDVLRG